MIAHLAAGLLVCALGAPRPDVASELARLGSPSANERAEAQGWLARHLAPDDLDELAAAVRLGGEEVRQRVAQVLGSADRHLGLAVLVASDREREVAAVGRAALVEQIERWSASAGDAPSPARRLPETWEEDWTRPLAVEVGRDELDHAFDLLDRLGGGPAPIVLDPSLQPSLRPEAARPRGAPRRVQGSWSEVLAELVRVERLSFEVVGRREPYEPDAPGARAFVRVSLRGDGAAGSAADHLSAWCLGVVREHDPRWNAACARALAASAWPAALAWLESRWLESGDAAALEGLLVAAERGRVAPALAQPESVARLVRAIDRRLEVQAEAALPFVERCARALGALGPLSPGGEVLEPELLAGFAEAAPIGRWARLVALELAARPGLEAGARCRELCRAGDTPLALRWQALRTLARVRTDDRPVALARAGELCDWAARAGLAEEAGWLLVTLAAEPDEPPPPVAHGPADRAARVVWALARGDESGAVAAGLAALDAPELSEPAELAEGLEVWVGLGWRRELSAWLTELSARLREGDPRAARLDSLALRAGLADDARRSVALARILASAPAQRAAQDWSDLAELASAERPSAAPARAALIAPLRQGIAPEGLLPALERAAQRLAGARDPELGSSFVADLRAAAVGSQHPLAGTLLGARWPAQAPRRAASLEAADRRWVP